jgi:4-hydroxy-tetrahydrodipicolinate synthase
VKEASGSLEQIARICRDRPPDVAVLAGDDAWTLPVLALGGDGVVSVASNEIPAEMTALCDAARAGDWAEARRIHERWLPLFLANFRGGPNPVPVKAALARMGLIGGDAVRQPLLPLDERAGAEMASTLRGLGLVDEGGRERHATVTAESVA